MLRICLYFIMNILKELCLSDLKRYHDSPSMLLHHLRWIIPEFFGIYYLYNVSRNLIEYLKYDWVPFHVLITFIIFILIIDLICSLIRCITIDLSSSLSLDFRAISPITYDAYYGLFVMD